MRVIRKLLVFPRNIVNSNACFGALLTLFALTIRTIATICIVHTLIATAAVSKVQVVVFTVERVSPATSQACFVF